MGKPKDPFENPDKKSVMRLEAGPGKRLLPIVSGCHVAIRARLWRHTSLKILKTGP